MSMIHFHTGGVELNYARHGPMAESMLSQFEEGVLDPYEVMVKLDLEGLSPELQDEVREFYITALVCSWSQMDELGQEIPEGGYGLSALGQARIVNEDVIPALRRGCEVVL